MGTAKQLGKFVSGGVLGMAVGTAVAILWAPQSGDELKGRLADLGRRAKLAGAEAKMTKEEQLIEKYRDEVEDPDALSAEATRARLEAAEAVANVGRSANAPGTIAAQESAHPATDTPVGVTPASAPLIDRSGAR